MRSIKPENWKYGELIGLVFVYAILLCNAFWFKDSFIAVLSAFFGITYTMLAGKGNPKCYIFGVAGSGLYGWLALTNALWGNFCLYFLYYIPMQIIGFFKWKHHLKENRNEILKSRLNIKEQLILLSLTVLLSIIAIIILNITQDSSPVIDGIVTVLSLVGMYLTVKRAIEQWVVWIVVNGLTSLMWINIVLSGEKTYSTVVMWVVYFILAIYFYREWKNEVV